MSAEGIKASCTVSTAIGAEGEVPYHSAHCDDGIKLPALGHCLCHDWHLKAAWDPRNLHRKHSDQEKLTHLVCGYLGKIHRRLARQAATSEGVQTLDFAALTEQDDLCKPAVIALC